MLLTITTTHRPATDLGYLLHKNPTRVQRTSLSFGTATVFYPQADETRCAVALLLEIDPVDLSRRPAGRPVEQYVNDRPYVVSSFMSVALAKVFGTALSGRSKERPELVEQSIPLRVEMPAVPSREGPELVRSLFEPLGYSVDARPHPLDPAFPDWGDSPYHHVTLEAVCPLRDLLRHLYVLLPVLDDRKHYWVGEDEVENLLRRGEGWLADHPDRDIIVRRALKRRGHLTRLALESLTEAEEPEMETAPPPRLNDQRLDAVVGVLEDSGARSVLDLGCGEGNLLRRLIRSSRFERLVGVDASLRALEIAHRRLGLAEASPRLKERIQLLHGALTYRDSRLEGHDAAALVEVVEHLDPPRLAAMERVVFGHARPLLVVVTTPNRDYNARFDTLPGGEFRHADHRFEWSREECRSWAERLANHHGYDAEFRPVGTVDEELGAPTQMVVFTRRETEASR